MAYRRLSFRLPPDLEDSLVAELWLAGTQGVQSLPGDDGRLRGEAYFPQGTEEVGVGVPAGGEGGEGGLALPGGVEMAADEVLADDDWFAGWRERARPFPVGRTLFVDPREPEE